MALVDEIPEAMVRAAQAGDRAALSRLLELLRPHAYRWALVQIAAPDDAEDIVQEALLRVVRGLEQFRHEARVTTWLHAIVRRTVADWRRRRGRRAALLDGGAATDVMAPEVAAVSQEESTAALVATVRSIMAGLTARQREVFDMVDMQGRSPAEAAQLMNMNPATVRVHLLRARRNIRTRLLLQHPQLMEDVE